MPKNKDIVRVYLTPEQKQQFKLTCTAKGIDMSQVASELIDEWLKENGVQVVSKTDTAQSDG